MSCLATVANTEAADVCGVDLSKQITWESMLEDGKKLHAENPEYYYMNVDTIFYVSMYCGLIFVRKLEIPLLSTVKEAWITRDES